MSCKANEQLKIYNHAEITSMYELHACMNDDVELYGLKAKSNQFKTFPGTKNVHGTN